MKASHRLQVGFCRIALRTRSIWPKVGCQRRVYLHHRGSLVCITFSSAWAFRTWPGVDCAQSLGFCSAASPIPKANRRTRHKICHMPLMIRSMQRVYRSETSAAKRRLAWPEVWALSVMISAASESGGGDLWRVHWPTALTKVRPGLPDNRAGKPGFRAAVGLIGAVRRAMLSRPVRNDNQPPVSRI